MNLAFRVTSKQAIISKRRLSIEDFRGQRMSSYAGIWNVLL